ncbi:hypothetical protein HZS55_07545 [Halosimplex rubrum]|uniref:Uncharacterized protein n=1 Tax=Halosimplex rubrum TaxID=869889 RepID=A0A7D5T5R6_9EURY|nr:hypothetical protein [Halosimplex rubrum]QLH77155.1 hypothetical protein HZS55_07545 [Halosimplex rubrum]
MTPTATPADTPTPSGPTSTPTPTDAPSTSYEQIDRDVSDDSTGASFSEVAVDTESPSVDRTSSTLSLRLNFWQGGASTLRVDGVRLA